MNFYLVGKLDSGELRYDLAEGVHLVGRADDVALKLAQPNISRHHAEITVRDGEIQVRDLGSHNGTQVNGAKVEGKVHLHMGDRLEFANHPFTVEGPAGPFAPATRHDHITPSAQISWDEVRDVGREAKNLQSLLFRVLAKAGDLLTIPRAPREMYEPILDLVETALLNPERMFVLLFEEGSTTPRQVAARVRGRGEDALVLSETMVRQVLKEKKSFLTSDSLDDLPGSGMMSMINLGIRSAIAVPLFDNEDVIGILYADDSRPQRTFIKDQLAAFTLLANIIAVALTHARYHEMEEQKRRQDAQLNTASEILDHMLLEELPVPAGYDILASLESCYEVGGDLYDGQHLADGRFAFLIGDVTGKGLGAALLVSHVLSLTRFMTSEGWEVQPLVTRLNQEIHRCTDLVRFTTLFMGYLEPDTGRITYVNAGHNPPLVVRASGEVDTCGPTGLPVGMLEEVEYGSGEITLNPGDMLALFSDGIPETQRLDDEEFGEERFQEYLVQERGSELQHLFSKLQIQLADFRGEAEVGDDVTLVTLRRR